MQGKAVTSMSEKDVKNYNNLYGFFLTLNGATKCYYIEELSIFPLVTYAKDGEDYFCVPGGAFFSETRTNYIYYKQNKGLKGIEELVPTSISKGAPDPSYV
jgi:hypothetical protein